MLQKLSIDQLQPGMFVNNVTKQNGTVKVKNQGENLNHKDFRYGNPDKRDTIEELKQALDINE